MGRWARLGMTITVTAAIVVGALTLIGHGGAPRTQLVTVEPGDTLWSVAGRAAPELDPRNVIAQMMTLNGLRDSDVVVGEVLRVPVG